MGRYITSPLKMHGGTRLEFDGELAWRGTLMADDIPICIGRWFDKAVVLIVGGPSSRNFLILIPGVRIEIRVTVCLLVRKIIGHTAIHTSRHRPWWRQ